MNTVFLPGLCDYCNKIETMNRCLSCISTASYSVIWTDRDCGKVICIGCVETRVDFFKLGYCLEHKNYNNATYMKYSEYDS